MNRLFALTLILLASCSVVEEVSKDNSFLAKQFNQHVALFNEDVDKANAILGKFGVANYASDLTQMQDIAEEYINFYNVQKNHLVEFQAFIITNERELDSLGANTFKWKKDINDAHATMQNNIKSMTEDIQTLAEYRRAQQQLSQQENDAVINFLKVLTSLL